MMAEYDSLIPRPNLNSERLLEHRGSKKDFARGLAKKQKQAAKAGPRAVRELAPKLLAWISDPRNLKGAWDHLARYSGQAPGCDGQRYSDYGELESWNICRALGNAIKSSDYKPQPERTVPIEKNGGKGYREISVLSIFDRDIQRAALQVLQPLVEPRFDPRCFGSRTGLNYRHALAHAEAIALTQNRLVWVSHDIQNAFGSVPLSRLWDIVRRHFSDDRLLEFLQRNLISAKCSGLRQGGPLSPFMLNLYLDYLLDRVWRKRFPTIPLIRYVDDILLLCRDLAEARVAEDELRRLLLPAGMKLKASPEQSIADLTTGTTMVWLGTKIYLANDGMAFELSLASWKKLTRGLLLAYERDEPQFIADKIVHAWLSARGACFHPSNAERVCSKILKRARCQGFEEIAAPDDLERYWQVANARWEKLRRKVQKQVGSN